MALHAIRALSIESIESGQRWDFKQGDIVPPEAQMALPAGRLEALRNSRHVEDIGDDLQVIVADLTRRIEALEEVKAAPKRGRPPKVSTEDLDAKREVA